MLHQLPGPSDAGAIPSSIDGAWRSIRNGKLVRGIRIGRRRALHVNAGGVPLLDRGDRVAVVLFAFVDVARVVEARPPHQARTFSATCFGMDRV